MAEKSLFEILLDENDSDNVVLLDEDGKEIEFEQVAVIPLGDKVYCILNPLNMPDVREDEAVVFEMSNAEDDSENLQLVSDEKTVTQVFEEYYRLCYGD